MPDILQKFDPYAMIKPKSEEDILALLDEAISELDNLSDHLRNVTTICEQNRRQNK